MNIILANSIFTLLIFGLAAYILLLAKKQNLTQKVLTERYIGTALSLIAFYWLGQYTNIFDSDKAQTFLEKVFIYYEYAIIPLTLVVYWLNCYLLPRAYACLIILSSYEIINQALITGINSTSRFFISLIAYTLVITMTYIFTKPWLLAKLDSKFKAKPKLAKNIAILLSLCSIITFILSCLSSKTF